MHPMAFLHPLRVPLRKTKVVQVLNAQPTGWLAKHGAECLRRSLLDDLGFSQDQLPHLPCCCHLGHLLNELRGHGLRRL